MDEDEFLHHLEIIMDLLKKPNARLILLHPPYTHSQQIVIDNVCKNSINIIGQVLRDPLTKEIVNEVGRLISSHHEPHINCDELKYVIVGKQKIKSH